MRKTASSRQRRTLRGVTGWCRKNRHQPIHEQHRQLCQKLQRHYAYYGIIGNSRSTGAGLEQASATDFVFFARRGGMVSNRAEDHEISMLALHLIQNCMVYINTLMIQKVLAQPHWHGRLTPRDYAALTPLIWEHVNPYGRFDLDMNAR